MPQQMIDIDVRGNKLTYSFVSCFSQKISSFHNSDVMASMLSYGLFQLKSVKLALADEDFKQLDHATFKEAFQAMHHLTIDFYDWLISLMRRGDCLKDVWHRC